MPFHSHYLNVAMVPHLFSRLDPVTKDKYKTRYIKFKEASSIASVTSVGVIDGYQMISDVLKSKLKAYGYKVFLVTSIGPIIQCLSIPIYALTQAGKLRKFSITACALGAKITKGEMTVVNWGWLILDITLFGEPIETFKDESMMLLRNESSNAVQNFITTLGD